MVEHNRDDRNRQQQLDPVNADMVQELMDITNRLISHNQQQDFRQVDLANILSRELSRVEGLRDDQRRKAQQKYASTLLVQTGDPTQAIEEFERLIRDHDKQDDDIVPYAVNLVTVAHLVIRQDGLSSRGRQTTRRSNQDENVRWQLREAAQIFSANEQIHYLGWAKFLKGVVALTDQNIPAATEHIVNGLRLMEQYQPTLPGPERAIPTQASPSRASTFSSASNSEASHFSTSGNRS